MYRETRPDYPSDTAAMMKVSIDHLGGFLVDQILDRGLQQTAHTHFLC